MAEELDNIWKFQRLTEEEKDINTNNSLEEEVIEERRIWLVGKLLTKCPFNKEAMMRTMKAIWKLRREEEIAALEENLFLFKFQWERDKERELEEAPWTFDK
ncbi:hypothetical protein PTKIN_Ptkin06aG0112500 [Pterospermum kingtungense]